MLGVRNGNIASGVEAGMQRASVVPSWTPRHNEAFRIGRRMTLLERQRRESFMKGMFIPFMLLALVWLPVWRYEYPSRGCAEGRRVRFGQCPYRHAEAVSGHPGIL